jgi:transcriptional regulator with XRE-family HTH domain
MSSFQITITPSKRAAGRFVSKVRRAIQKALAEEEQAQGTTQSDIARSIGVNRSVISREIRGHKDLTLGRVGEIAWALRRMPSFELLKVTVALGPDMPFTRRELPPGLPEPRATTNTDGQHAKPRMLEVVS